MSYKPLHLKYRPQTFAELVGQEAIATILTNALRLNRIAPAYLFTGPRGTGKTSSARIMAKSLNCLNSQAPTERPCGFCDICQSIAGGYSLDVIEIDAASNSGVEHIRELIEKAQFAPVQCRYKVYCIDEVHGLSNSAMNALLLTLESPPERVVFLLCTTDPQKILPTIISRCQRFDFKRIDIEAMVSHLIAIADKEAIDITDEAVRLVAQIAQGGLRDAETLLEQVSLLPGTVSPLQVWDLVGAVPEKDLMDLLEAIADNNPESLLDRVRELMNRGREPLRILQNLASFYRDLLIAKTAPNRSDLVAIAPSIWHQLCQQANQWDAFVILASQQHLAKSETQIKNASQPRLWLEVTLLGLLSIQKTLSTPTVGGSYNSSGSVALLAPTPNSATSATPLSIQDIWQATLKQLPLATKTLLQQHGEIVALEGDTATVKISSEALMKKVSIDRLQTALSKIRASNTNIKLTY